MRRGGRVGAWRGLGGRGGRSEGGGRAHGAMAFRLSHLTPRYGHFPLSPVVMLQSIVRRPEGEGQGFDIIGIWRRPVVERRCNRLGQRQAWLVQTQAGHFGLPNRSRRTGCSVQRAAADRRAFRGQARRPALLARADLWR
jgi:hypothetical protein